MLTVNVKNIIFIRKSPVGKNIMTSILFESGARLRRFKS